MNGLGRVHETFTRWLGDSYDLVALNAVLATAAAEQLGGDPPWLLVVSGSGNAKTETVVALAGINAHITSTVTGEGALLSASSQKEKAKDATGGLLRKIGPRGLLVVKDFTSIISMSRDARASVLAALREVHDGRWERNVGMDGGRTLTWEGRLVLIGATTTAYDSAHTVISSMGDRFALIRMDSGHSKTRQAAGRRALMNVDLEEQMRKELSTVVGDLLRNLRLEEAVLHPDDQEALLLVADLVTMARTAVERDYQGNVTDAHAPEMPTRFAKMLGQIVRGCLAIGLTREEAVATAVRVAGDSMPPLRLAVLGDVATHPMSQATDVRKRLQKPHNTVDRELQALHILGLLVQNEHSGRSWAYTLGPNADKHTVEVLISRNGYLYTRDTREESETPGTPPAKFGNGASDARTDWDARRHEMNEHEPSDRDMCPDCGESYESLGHEIECEGLEEPTAA